MNESAICTPRSWPRRHLGLYIHTHIRNAFMTYDTIGLAYKSEINMCIYIYFSYMRHHAVGLLDASDELLFFTFSLLREALKLADLGLQLPHQLQKYKY
jgi:hypothetical protein